ncbi:MAG: hypothetical protein ACRDU4_21030 [Mycobacterium sp.]
MIDAELTADLHDPEHVIGVLRGWATEDRWSQHPARWRMHRQ